MFAIGSLAILAVTIGTTSRVLATHAVRSSLYELSRATHRAIGSVPMIIRPLRRMVCCTVEQVIFFQ